MFTQQHIVWYPASIEPLCCKQLWTYGPEGFGVNTYVCGEGWDTATPVLYWARPPVPVDFVIEDETPRVSHYIGMLYAADPNEVQVHRYAMSGTEDLISRLRDSKKDFISRLRDSK